MIRKALRRANRSYVFTLVLALLFAAGYVGSTYAYFDGTVSDTATYAGGTIGLPILIGTPAPQGYGASFGWTPATIGLNGQAIYSFDNGGTSSCTGLTYTAVVTGIATNVATTTVSGPSSQNGHYVCYEIRSTHGGPAGTSGTTTQAFTYTTANATTTVTTPVTTVLTMTGLGWYQVTDFAGVRVGLIPTSVATANGGTSGSLDNGDTVTIVYNQVVTVGSSPVTVMGCANATAGQGKILLGASSCAGSPSIGQITGLTMTGSTRTYTSSAVTPSSSTVVLTVGGGASGANGRTPVTGSGTFTGSGSNIASSVGSATVCNCTTITPTGGY
jgi:hypothetical protein